MAANRQMIDVEKMASAAASAASQTAVEVALQHHRDQLEKLKKEALEKGIKIFGLDILHRPVLMFLS